MIYCIYEYTKQKFNQKNLDKIRNKSENRPKKICKFNQNTTDFYVMNQYEKLKFIYFLIILDGPVKKKPIKLLKQKNY